MKTPIAQKLAECFVPQSAATRRSAVATQSAVARFVRSGTATRIRRSAVPFLAPAFLAIALLLLLALPRSASAQIGRRFPSEKKIVVDSVTGVPLSFLTSGEGGDSKIYQTHHQWTSDGKWLVFRSNRVPGQAMAVNEATGDLVQVTAAGYSGMLCLATHSMNLYFLRIVTLPGEAVVPPPDVATIASAGTQGYRKGARKGDYQVFLSPTPWKPRVFVHDDGWVTVKRQPPRIHAPGRSFADEGNRAEYLWCILAPTACVSVGGWVVSERKLARQKQEVYEATRQAARELNDAVARDALGNRLNEVIPADLERIWSQPLPGEERRRLLFLYWDTRTDTPEGHAAQGVIQDFLDAVVQSSAEPFTAAELAAWNATRSSLVGLTLAEPGP